MRAPAKYLHEAVGAYLRGYRGAYVDAAAAAEEEPEPEGQFFPATQAEALTWSGITWANLYPCQDVSAQIADAIGSAHLLEAVSPNYQVATDFAPRVAVSHDAGSNDAFTADVFNDDGATSRAFLMLVKLPAVLGVTGGLFSRNVGSTAAGYRAIFSSGGGFLRARVHEGVSEATAVIEVDHAGYQGPIAVVTDYSTSLLGIYSLLGSGTVDISTLGAFTSAAPFFVGRAVGAAQAQGQIMHLLLQGEGENVEGKDWPSILSDIWVGP